MSLPILYDAWPLVYQPNSPAALHLYSLLCLLPEQIQAQVALPGPAPDWLPDGLTTYTMPTADTPAARLGWEQRILPGLKRELGAPLLHHTSASPPLFGTADSVLSPSATGALPRQAGFAGRLRSALAAGGMARLRARFWPADLPEPEAGAPLFRLPPGADLAVLSKHGGNLDALELPESYVLYHGPAAQADLQRLLEAWSWAAGPLGQQVRLALVGIDEQAARRLKALLQAFDLADSVQALPPLPPEQLPALYRGSLALFHPAPAPPWGGPLRLALACARPVVAAAGSIAAAITGPAAYLLDREDERGLGAALISVIIEEELAQRLSLAGKQRAATWQAGEFGPALLDAYSRILERQNG